MAAALGLAVTPWGVLEAGALTGKPAAERRWPDSGNSPAAERVVAALRKVAGGVGASPAQVAIAWLLHRDEPPPIVGARRAEQIVAGLDALELVLDPAQLEELEAAGLPQLGFPRSFLESEEVRELIYGTTFAQLVP
jgi:aryl-alcohol dehydrogenase-like predicted oxidoreductase